MRHSPCETPTVGNQQTHFAQVRYPREAPSARLARLSVPPAPLPLLDAGAGDGLSGVQLREAGFSTGVASITAVDLSPKLLDIARRRGCYDTCRVADLSSTLEFAGGSFVGLSVGLSCVGTLTYLAPGCGVLDEFVRVVRAGGFVVYNLRSDHEAAWLPAQKALADAGRW
eukprot:Hpha_TRINITY_DN1635_c0_g1::TRINITY_DN1635_c0_g1_i2::g.48896::m.48896